MSIHKPTAQTMSRGMQNALQSQVIPAPIGGMDGQLNLASNDPSNCVFAFNMVPTEFGMRTRKGYQEWQKDIETVPGNGLGVRTIIPYHGKAENQALDKLFVSTNEGIWDVTIKGDAPILAVAFGDTGITSGWGVFSHYVTDAGEQRIFLADSANGLHQYDPVLDTWTLSTLITGLVIADVVFVVVHKQRIWFIEKNSTDAKYLSIGALTGAATTFSFGAKFQHGGDLAGLYNWTLDSGSGVDDRLVAISRAGDVIAWEGEDPGSADKWRTIGTWFIGQIPVNRRVASEYGGNLHILSSFGLTTMSDLLRGFAFTPQAGSVPRKISRFIRQDMEQLLTEFGWEIRFHADEGTLVINSPKRLNDEFRQFRVNLTVEAWAFWRGVPMLTSDNFQGNLMFGTEDNTIQRMDVNSDKVTPTSVGSPVEFSVLGNFFDYGSPGQFKWGTFIRPNFVSELPPSFDAKFVYDFRTQEITDPGVPSPPDVEGWDVALWDTTGIWDGGSPIPFGGLFGQFAQPGRTMAVAIRGSSISRTTLVSQDVTWHVGGPF